MSVSIGTGVNRGASVSDGVSVGGGSVVDSGGGGSFSPEVQAVFDRMTDLTQTEMDAIEAMVDGMVDDFTYENVFEFWAPCLTGTTDHQTGFKVFPSSEMNVQGSPVHVPGEGLRPASPASGWLMTTAFNTLPLTTDNSGAFSYFHNEGSYIDTGNGDYFGITSGTGLEAYMRNRSDANSFDINSVWNQTSATPRVSITGLLHEDLIGLWSQPTESYVLHPGAVIDSVARTDGVANVNPFGWSGRNNNGVLQFSPQGLHRIFMFMEKPDPTNVQLVRARVLQFLRDLGIADIPAGFDEGFDEGFEQ